MRLLIWVPCLLLMGVVTVPAEDKVSRDETVDQLKVFDRYIGQWKFKMQATGGIVMTGGMKTVWIHGGKLVRQSWTMEPTADSPAASGENIMTFDVPKGVYRQWSFNSFGHTTELTGKWDYEKQTMIWTGQDSLGHESVTRTNFADKDNEKFLITVKGPDGQTVVEFEGTSTREQ